MKIGFIGLGIMGSRMAANLIAAGYELIVYNRTSAKTEALREKGAYVAASPAELAREADIIITVVADPQAIKNIAYGEQGILDNARHDTLWINCTTIDPDSASTFDFAAGIKGLRYLDAPVAGTRKPAEDGELVFLTGGRQDDLEEARPLLHCMGNKVIHAGQAGQGSAMKMVINLMLGHAMSAFSEAIQLGEALGLTRETLFATLSGGPVTAPFLSAKEDKIKNGDYEADFPLKWMYKDLQLVTQTAYDYNVSLPSTNSVKEVYALAKQYGFEDMDFSAVYEFLRGDK